MHGPQGPFFFAVHYCFKHSQTKDTTGYFSCLPDPGPDFSTGLRLLAERPLDTFLHNYLLTELLKLNEKDWLRLAKRASLEQEPVFAALLVAGARFNPELRAAIAQDKAALTSLASPWHQFGPLPPRLEADRDLAEACRQNVHDHRPLPDNAQLGEAKLAEHSQKMAEAQGVLAKNHAFFKQQPAVARQNADLKTTLGKALAVLAANDLAAGPEMRHEASLCPIALLRQWQLHASVAPGKTRHTLDGVATAYGRGLSLGQARVSCVMEIIERASAHARVEAGGKWGRIGKQELILATFAELAAKGQKAFDPGWLAPGLDIKNIPLHWLSGETTQGEAILAPAQAVYLFCNLEEPELFATLGSTGLAAGAEATDAKLAALTEICERYSHATMPFLAGQCFELASRDPVIQGLLDDYRWRGIRVQFQDITTELGIPAYRCFVRNLKGELAQATGANLSGKRAALAALTETPHPYAWATPMPAPTDRGLPNLPLRFLEDLPDFNLASPAKALQMLEKSLQELGYSPVYVDISRPELHFPVYRAFLPGCAIDPEFENGPNDKFLARYILQKGN